MSEIRTVYPVEVVIPKGWKPIAFREPVLGEKYMAFESGNTNSIIPVPFERGDARWDEPGLSRKRLIIVGSNKPNVWAVTI